LLLALVFVVAGVAKLADRAGSRQAMRDFGLPAALANPFGLLLPLAELTVAAALIPTSTAWWGALGALALLLLFVAGIGINLARGRKPDCRCFGQLHSSPAGWSTLLRNGILTAVAGFIVWQGRDAAGLSAVSWLGTLSTVQLLALIGGLLVLGLLAAGGWLLVHLLRQNGRLLMRLEALEEKLASGEAAAPEAEAPQAQPEAGLPVGTEAPTFSLRGLYGETLTLEALRAPSKPVMLLFTDPNCGPCTAMLPEIGRWQQEHAEKLTVSLISRGTPEENRAKSSEHGLTNVLLQEDWEISEAYQVTGTPSAVIVGPDGKVGSPVAGGSVAIESLVAQTLGAPAPELPVHPQQAQGEPCPNCGQVHADNGQAASAGLNIGEPAPEIKLKDLSGKSVELKDFRGKKTLVLFWNPGCGFCQQMLDDLKALEADPPEGAPKILVVSAGEVEANKALGLRSPVVLDQSFSVGSAFGANGTPMAVLVDEEGKIASELAAGAPAVLALAGVAQDPTGNGSGGGQAVPAARKVGEPAPSVKLPNLKGNTVDLADFRGKKTLVLFWNPGCGFCQQMLDDLKAWEADPPKGAPKLLVVSAGSVEDNRAMGLRSTLVLDQGFNAGLAFGASGTPSAVLVDRKGNIASELAVGAPGVLALAGTSQSV
jgi:methylamine dehydrogenase accessory protein MauD